MESSMPCCNGNPLIGKDTFIVPLVSAPTTMMPPNVFAKEATVLGMSQF
jgi:hypothetical protein